MTPVQTGFEYYVIIDAVNDDRRILAFYRINGNIEFLTVDGEFILTHFLGFFLKLFKGLPQALSWGIIVMMPGSISCTVSFR